MTLALRKHPPQDRTHSCTDSGRSCFLAESSQGQSGRLARFSIGGSRMETMLIVLVNCGAKAARSIPLPALTPNTLMSLAGCELKRPVARLPRGLGDAWQALDSA
jgi:hypothetical protein